MVTKTTSPTFTEGDDTTRAVSEGTAKGTNIGSPVTATDTDTAEKLTYWLNGNDDGLFDIDPMTGQLKVKIRAGLRGRWRVELYINQLHRRQRVFSRSQRRRLLR